MCGRFASARKRQELLAEFQIERDRVDEPLAADYNVAPTKRVYAVVSRAARDGDGAPAAQEVARELRVVRWGLVPSWAKDVAIGSRLINARAETVDAKPAFRHAFSRRRCLLPADGFYEWQESAEGKKQPYFIHRRDGGVLAFAGLYELWRNAAYPDDHPQAWLWTATIITTAAQDEVGRIHDRMPMVIDSGRWDDWLDPGATSPAQVLPLLAPALAGGLASYPVSSDVNSVRNNGPGLIAPVPGAGERRMGAQQPAGRTGRSAPAQQPDSPAGVPLTLF